jgi:hypothetical protein
MAKRSLLITSLLAFFAALVPLHPSARAQESMTDGQRLALYIKPAVVRIYDGYLGTFVIESQQFNVSLVGSGSGSIINPNGYVLTNAHVVDFSHQGDEKGQEALFGQLVANLAQQIGQERGLNPQQLAQNPQFIQAVRENARLANFQHIHHVVLPNGDALPFEIKEFGAPVGQGKDVAVVKIEIKNAPTLTIGDSDKVQLQDHLTVFGYPGAADTFDTGLLDQKSALEASITDGKLSAKKNSADGAPILQISAPATHGNSGGPVLADSGEVIGLLTFRGDTVNGQEVSGFAFVVPTSTAMEFIKKAGTTNEPSATDQRYREGLDLYNEGYYTAAIQKFEEVRRLFPQHSEAGRLISDAQGKISQGKERSSPLPWVIAGILFLLFVFFVIGVVAFVLLRRGKKRKALPQQGYGGDYQSQPSMNYMPQQQPYGAPPPPPVTPQPSPPISPQMGGGGGGDRTMVVGAVGGAAYADAGLGTLVGISGPVAGQQFDVRGDGFYIGRDGSLSQVVINDGRVSKRHVWIGARNGRVVAVDQGSTNGTFLNQPGSQRITEAYLNPGDVVIISEADVARFRYQK